MANKSSFISFRHVSAALTVLVAIFAVYPLVRVVLRLFWYDGHFNIDALRRVLTIPSLGELIVNTLIVVALSTLIALVIGTLLAWLNERTDARMGVLTDIFPFIPFLLPPVAGAIGAVLLLSPRAGFVNVWLRSGLSSIGIHFDSGPLDVYSWYGLIAVYVIYLVPFSFLMISAGLRNLDPDLEEQSRMSGARTSRTLTRVILPGLAPAAGASVLLMIWQGLAMFSIPVIIGASANIDVLTVRVIELMSFTYPPEVDLSVGLASILMILAIGSWYLQRLLLKRSKYATIQGRGRRAPVRIRLGFAKWVARGAIIFYIFITTILPTVALILVTLTGHWTPNIEFGKLSLDAVRSTIVDDPLSLSALMNSLVLGFVCATLGILIASMISVYLRGINSLVATPLDGLVKLPGVISHVVIAIGIMLAFAGPPFGMAGTLTILALAYFVLYFPQGSVATDAAAFQVGKELIEASNLSGAGEGRTFRRVLLPLMLPAMVVGWAMIFSRVVGDLTASALLAGTGNPVVGYRILNIYNNGSYAKVAALATVLTFVTAVVVGIVMLIMKKRSKWNREQTSVRMV